VLRDDSTKVIGRNLPIPMDTTRGSRPSLGNVPIDLPHALPGYLPWHSSMEPPEPTALIESGEPVCPSHIVVIEDASLMKKMRLRSPWDTTRVPVIERWSWPSHDRSNLGIDGTTGSRLSTNWLEWGRYSVTKAHRGWPMHPFPRNGRRGKEDVADRFGPAVPGVSPGTLARVVVHGQVRQNW
jgi:hypothetical protein